jgi:hypothetical protein
MAEHPESFRKIRRRKWCRTSVIATGINRTRQSEDGKWKKRLDMSNVSSASPVRLIQNARTGFPVPEAIIRWNGIVIRTR